MKKLITVFLAALCLFGLAACTTEKVDPDKPVFNTENISKISFTLQPIGEVDVPETDLAAISQWLATFRLGERVKDPLPPGSNSIWVKIVYQDGTSMENGLSTYPVGDKNYLLTAEDAPACYQELLDGASENSTPAQPPVDIAEAEIVLQVQYASEVDLTAYANAYQVADPLSTDAYALQILLTVNQPITDFRYFVLEYDDSGEEIAFRAGQELYAADQLTADTPLLLWAAFPGVAPIRGLSFTDPTGATQFYGLGQSGEDGSLLLVDLNSQLQTP